MTLRLRLEGDAERLYRFARCHDYPLEEGGWSTARLQDEAIMVRVETDPDGDTVGYIWGTWAFLPNVLDLHACISRKYRGRWLSPDLWLQLRWLARFVGAEMLTARAVGDRSARLIAAFLQRRLGWKCAEDNRLYTRID